MRHDLLTRVLTRCAEVAGETDALSAVKRVYNDRLKGPAEAYLEAQKQLPRAESSWAKEKSEAVESLASLDQAYKLSRSVVAAYLPNEVLPDTLKTLSTDTDKIGAMGALLVILNDHSEEEWAAEQLASSEFGTKAPQTVIELDEAVAASKQVSEAQDKRSQAYGPAWDRYLAFKRVVCDAYGPSSKQYRRIHIRESASTEEPSEE